MCVYKFVVPDMQHFCLLVPDMHTHDSQLCIPPYSLLPTPYSSLTPPYSSLLLPTPVYSIHTTRYYIPGDDEWRQLAFRARDATHGNRPRGLEPEPGLWCARGLGLPGMHGMYAWYGIQYGMVFKKYGIITDMVWYGMVFNIVWHCMMWYGMVCNTVAR